VRRVHDASRQHVEVVADPDALSREGASIVQRILDDAARERGQVSVALAGGRTPQRLYERLAIPEAGSPAPPWTRLHVFFSDERFVPPEHPDSNFRMARDTLLSRVPIPPAQVHRVRTEAGDAAVGAAEYERQILATFGVKSTERPRFDLILLGMGSDGHTASLFPHTPVLHERERLVAAVWVPALKASRISMTYPVLNAADHVLVLVSGVEKAETLRFVLEGPVQPDERPIQGVQPRPGRLLWLVDEPAASQLSGLDGLDGARHR
jgi:6-phosphogluconolactonase